MPKTAAFALFSHPPADATGWTSGTGRQVIFSQSCQPGVRKSQGVRWLHSGFFGSTVSPRCQFFTRSRSVPRTEDRATGPAASHQRLGRTRGSSGSGSLSTAVTSSSAKIGARSRLTWTPMISRAPLELPRRLHTSGSTAQATSSAPTIPVPMPIAGPPGVGSPYPFRDNDRAKRSTSITKRSCMPSASFSPASCAST